MLAVISPAKKMNFDPISGIDDSLPKFQAEANILAGHARQLSAKKLREMMKISDDLAKQNKERFAAFTEEPTDLNSKQAAFAFAGDTYMGLQIDQFSKRDLAYAQDHLRILSGLYGVLRPLDRIQPYRLEMGRKLKTRRGETLYDFWRNDIGAALDEVADGKIVNLASKEYFKSTGKNLSAEVVTPDFKEERDGKHIMIGFFAKKARGMMARYMMQNRVTDFEALKHFSEEGYKFNPALSSGATMTFTRPPQS